MLVSRSGQFLDIDRSDLFRLSGADALSAITDGVGHDSATLEVHAANFIDEGFAVELLSPKFSEEVRPGDLIRAGLRVEHSFLGHQATVITTFVYRLVCKNGLIHRDCQNQRRSPRTLPDRCCSSSRSQAANGTNPATHKPHVVASARAN